MMKLVLLKYDIVLAEKSDLIFWHQGSQKLCVLKCSKVYDYNEGH